MRLQDVANAICDKAGWDKAVPNDEQIITFELSDNMVFNIHSPDGMKIFFFSYLKEIPYDEYTAKSMIEKCAKRSFGTCKKNNSVLSITDNKFMLHLDVSLLSEMEIVDQAKNFLNDLAKWNNFIITI